MTAVWSPAPAVACKLAPQIPEPFCLTSQPSITKEKGLIVTAFLPWPAEALSARPLTLLARAVFSVSALSPL